MLQSKDDQFDLLIALIESGLDSEEKEIRYPLNLPLHQMLASILGSKRRRASQSKNGKKGGNPNFKKGHPNPYFSKLKHNPNITQDITQNNLNENVNKNVNETDSYLHKNSVSDGSPLNAEPPSTQSTEKRYNVFGQELDEHGFVKRKPE